MTGVGHHLPAGPDTVLWGHIDPERPPALKIAPGDSVTVDTLSGGPRNLPPEASRHRPLPEHLAVISTQQRLLGPHMLTGPIYVEGALPGDRLIVEIEKISLTQDWGWNAIEPGFGLFPDLAPAYENLIVPIDRRRRRAKLPWGPEVRLEPFFGILAVAPPRELGVVSSVPPGVFGGNVDTKLFRVGARISFPVFAPGALFFAGDGHALQGEGEICDTALETALRGRFKFTLEKGTAPAAPEVEFGPIIATFGFDASLETAVSQSAERMIDWLCRRSTLSRSDAYRHLSLCADLRITQLVNGQKGAHCLLDRGSLAGIAGLQ